MKLRQLICDWVNFNVSKTGACITITDELAWKAEMITGIELIVEEEDNVEGGYVMK